MGGTRKRVYVYNYSFFFTNILVPLIFLTNILVPLDEVAFSLRKASFFPPWESWVYTIKLNRNTNFIIVCLHYIFFTLSSTSITLNLTYCHQHRSQRSPSLSFFLFQMEIKMTIKDLFLYKNSVFL